MRSRTWLFFLFFFIFSSCNPRAKQSTSFNSATSLSDETVKFLSPAVDAEYIDGGVRLETMIPGDASHVEINFNGTFLKSCSAETLIPEGVATCPVGEESCEIQVKACDEATKECSESLDVTVFMDKESAFPSDVQSVMAAYELEQEQLQLARDLKLEACVAAKELEKYSEADVSPEALALRDGIEAICKTSDCDVVLGFDQFKSDLEGLISQLAIQAVLEDEADDTGELSETEEGDDTTDVTGNDTDEPSETEEGDDTNELSEEDTNELSENDTNELSEDDTNDFDEEDTNKLSDTEIALTAVSATLGVALLGGGGTGIYLWRKQARLEGELRAKDINLISLNQNLVDLNKTKQDLEKKIAEGGNKEELEKLKALVSQQEAQLIEQKRLAEEAIKQRTDAETKLTKAKAEYEAAKAKSLEEMQAKIAELKKVNAKNAEQLAELEELRKKVQEMQDLNKEKAEVDNKLHVAELRITEIEELLAKSKAETEKLNSSLLVNQTELTNAEGRIEELKKTGVTSSEELELIKNKNVKLKKKIKVQENRIELGIKNYNELRARIEKDKNNAKKLIAKNEDLNKQLEAKNAELEKMKSENMGVRNLISELIPANDVNSKKTSVELITEVQTYLAKKAEEIKNNAEEIGRQKGEIKKLQDEAKAAEDAKAAKDSEVAELNKKLAAATNSLEDLERTKKELAAANQKITSLETSVDSLKTDVNNKGKTIVLIRWQNFLRAHKHQGEIKKLQKEFKKKNDENLVKINELTHEVEDLKGKEETYRRINDNTNNLQAKIQELKSKLLEAKTAQQLVETKLDDVSKGYTTEEYQSLIKQNKNLLNQIENEKGFTQYNISLREAQEKFNHIWDSLSPNKKNILRGNGLQKYAIDTKLRIKPLIQDETEAMETILNFFGNTVLKTHKKAYQNNLELEELRVNFF